MTKFNLSDYEEVKDRIPKFLKKYKGARIITDLMSSVEELASVVFRASLYDGDTLMATGWATEDRNRGYINKVSHLENCETSAIGRALANLGLHGDKRASREEMGKVRREETKEVDREELKKMKREREQQREPLKAFPVKVYTPFNKDKCPFGKHKGEPWEMIRAEDPQYILWLYDNAKKEDQKVFYKNLLVKNTADVERIKAEIATLIKNTAEDKERPKKEIEEILRAKYGDRISTINIDKLRVLKNEIAGFLSLGE